MGGVVEGAALGAVFERLLVSVGDAAQKVACFSSDLNRLKSTLSSIKPVIDDVESFNRILERPQHETEAFRIRLIQGEQLIRKCSQVKWFNVYKRLYYSRKLIKLEALLLNFFQIEVAALHFRETKTISVVLNNLQEKITEMTMMLNRCRCRDAFSDIVHGFEQTGEGTGTPIDEEGGSVVELRLLLIVEVA